MDSNRTTIRDDDPGAVYERLLERRIMKGRAMRRAFKGIHSRPSLRRVGPLPGKDGAR